VRWLSCQRSPRKVCVDVKHWGIARRALGLGVLIAAVAGGSARADTSANTTVDTSWCAMPSFSQPFLSLGDRNWYTLVPGETPGSFDGTGWQLSGGASIITTTLADGSTTSILDMPSGSTAVSPPICVTSDYPRARTMVRDVRGSEGVSFYVGYEGTNTWDTPRNTGQVHGRQTNWSLSDPVNIQPENVPGWQPVRFTLVAGGKRSDFQLYDFYVDPRFMW
jgi:hypothetical protein